MKTRSQRARERDRLVIKQQPVAEMKKESDIHNVTDSNIARVKVEEEHAKIENYSENNIKITDSGYYFKTERDGSIPPTEFKIYDTNTIVCTRRQSTALIHCKLCFKTFKTKDYLKRHERTHIPSAQRAKYKCTRCDKHYTCNRDLRRHNETHLQETERTTHPCMLCDKSFGRKSALRDHEKTHLPDSERVKYACSLCDKSFKWKKHLHRHNKTHLIQIDP